MRDSPKPLSGPLEVWVGFVDFTDKPLSKPQLGTFGSSGPVLRTSLINRYQNLGWGSLEVWSLKVL